MTSGQQANPSSAMVQTYAVTVGNSGSSDYGYSNVTLFYGSMTPLNYKNQLIVAVSTSSSGANFSLKVNNIQPQNFFASLIQQTAGGVQRLVTSAATYVANDGTGRSIWTWAGSPGWVVGDVGAARLVTLQG